MNSSIKTLVFLVAELVKVWLDTFGGQILTNSATITLENDVLKISI